MKYFCGGKRIKNLEIESEGRHKEDNDHDRVEIRTSPHVMYAFSHAAHTRAPWHEKKLTLSKVQEARYYYEI